MSREIEGPFGKLTQFVFKASVKQGTVGHEKIHSPCSTGADQPVTMHFWRVGTNVYMVGCSFPACRGESVKYQTFFTPQPLRAVGVLFSPMVSGWAGGRVGGGK